MKNIFLKISIGILGVLLWSQCEVLSTVPPTNPPPPPAPSQSKFEQVDYHIFSQLHEEYLVADDFLKMQKLGSVKAKGMYWRIELVENLEEEFYRIRSPFSTYLHIEYGKLEATRLGAPGWHSAMWKIEAIDKPNNVYKVSNRWKSDLYLQFDSEKVLVERINERSLSHFVGIVEAKDVLANEVDPVTENPLVTYLNGNPLKNGHPNLEPSLPNQTTINASSSTGAEAFLGQIKMFAGNFAPRGWAFCNGQILSVNENQPLYSLLGTSYGGDGRTTFALPDLRGRAPVHAGKTLGGIPAEYKLGNRYGSAKANVYREEYQNRDNLKKLIDVSDGVTIPSSKTSTPATLSIHYIIAVSGNFPSRN